jgi:hypothetical protein
MELESPQARQCMRKDTDVAMNSTSIMMVNSKFSSSEFEDQSFVQRCILRLPFLCTRCLVVVRLLDSFKSELKNNPIQRYLFAVGISLHSNTRKALNNHGHDILALSAEV